MVLTSMEYALLERLVLAQEAIVEKLDVLLRVPTIAPGFDPSVLMDPGPVMLHVMPRPRSTVSLPCMARQFSDKMHCGPCGLTWDVNDGNPPACQSRTE